MSLVDSLDYLFEDFLGSEPAGQDAELESNSHHVATGGKSVAMLLAAGIDVNDCAESDDECEGQVVVASNGPEHLEFAGKYASCSNTVVNTSEDFGQDRFRLGSPLTPVSHDDEYESDLDDTEESDGEESSTCSSVEDATDESDCEDAIPHKSDDKDRLELPTAFFKSNPAILAEIFDEEPAILENCLSADPSLLHNYLQAKPDVLRNFFEESSGTLFYYLSTNVSKLGQFFQANPKLLEELIDDDCLAELVKYYEDSQKPKCSQKRTPSVAGPAKHETMPLKEITPCDSKIIPTSDKNNPTSTEQDNGMFGVYLSDSEAPTTRDEGQKSTIRSELENDMTSDQNPIMDTEVEESEEDVITPYRRHNVKAQKSTHHPEPRKVNSDELPPMAKADSKEDKDSDSEDNYTTDDSTADSDDEEEEYATDDGDMDITPARALVPYPAPGRLLKESKRIKSGKKWRLFEEDLAIGHMLDIRDENEIQGEERFRETADRLLAINKIKRSHGAVKNFWNRTGRARSGFDERKNKKAPLATSQQGKDVQKKRKAAQTARNQELARNVAQASTTTSDDHIISSAASTKTNDLETNLTPKTPSKPSARKLPAIHTPHMSPVTSSRSNKDASPLPTPTSASKKPAKDDSARRPSASKRPAAERISLSAKDLEKIIADAQAKANNLTEEKLNALLDQRLANMGASRSSENNKSQSTSISGQKRSHKSEGELEEGQLDDELPAKKQRVSPAGNVKVQNERYGQSPSERRVQRHEMTKTEKFYSDARRPSPVKREVERQDRNYENIRGNYDRRDTYRPRQDHRARHEDHDRYRYRTDDYNRRSYDQGHRRGSRY